MRARVLAVRLIAATVLLAIAACSRRAEAPSTQPPAGPPGGASRAIMLGSVSTTPSREIQVFGPLAAHMARRLGDPPTTAANPGVIVTASVAEMAELLRSGRVDLYIDSLLPVLRACTLSGARPFLRRWKNGANEYQGLILVRVRDEMHTLQDLRGRRIAFESSFSTSAYYLPKAALLGAGLRLREHPAGGATVAGDEVGYFFTSNEDSGLPLLLRGKVDAVALSTDDLQRATKGQTDARLQILWRSPSFVRHVVARRPDLAEERLAAIERVLLTMDQDEEGRHVLARFERTTRFERFQDGGERALDPIRELLAPILDELQK